MRVRPGDLVRPHGSAVAFVRAEGGTFVDVGGRWSLGLVVTVEVTDYGSIFLQVVSDGSLRWIAGLYTAVVR